MRKHTTSWFPISGHKILWKFKHTYSLDFMEIYGPGKLETHSESPATGWARDMAHLGIRTWVTFMTFWVSSLNVTDSSEFPCCLLQSTRLTPGGRADAHGEPPAPRLPSRSLESGKEDKTWHTQTTEITANNQRSPSRDTQMMKFCPAGRVGVTAGSLGGLCGRHSSQLGQRSVNSVDVSEGPRANDPAVSLVPRRRRE